MTKLITIFNANNLIEAEIIKDVLAAHRIKVSILNKHMATLYPPVEAVL